MAVSRLSPTAALDKFRHGIELLGAKNGVNTTYTTPEIYRSGTLHLYWNGQRLLEGTGNDYTASESGGVGTGFDTVVFEPGCGPPRLGDVIQADYLIP